MSTNRSLTNLIADELRHLAASWARRRTLGLRDLDDRALADLGVHRSEIGSIEAEQLRRVAPTRRRIVIDAPALPHHA